MTEASGVGTLLDTRRAASYDATNRVRRFLNQAHVKVAGPLRACTSQLLSVAVSSCLARHHCAERWLRQDA